MAEINISSLTGVRKQIALACDKNNDGKLTNARNEIKLFNESIREYERTGSCFVNGKQFGRTSPKIQGDTTTRDGLKPDAAVVASRMNNPKPTKKTAAKTNAAPKAVPRRVKNNLCASTRATNSEQYPKTPIPYINLARTYLNQIVEVNSSAEYNRLNKTEKDTTQMAIIGGQTTILFNGKPLNAAPGQSWCAWTVSALLHKSGIKSIPTFSAVDQFVKWARDNKRYREVENINKKTTANGIKKQLPNIKQGDLIIFKNKRDNGNMASHIGIIEFVDPNKGTITTLEGNAKGKREIEAKEGEDYDKKDGFVRKVYTIQELINYGYSGYISMTGVK